MKTKKLKQKKFTFELHVQCEVVAETYEEAERLAQDSVLSGSNGADATLMSTDHIGTDDLIQVTW